MYINEDELSIEAKLLSNKETYVIRKADKKINGQIDRQTDR